MAADGGGADAASGTSGDARKSSARRLTKPRAKELHPLAGEADSSRSGQRGSELSPALQRAIAHLARHEETEADIAVLRSAQHDPHLSGPVREAVQAFRQVDLLRSKQDEDRENYAPHASNDADAFRVGREAYRNSLSASTQAAEHRDSLVNLATRLHELFESDRYVDHLRAVEAMKHPGGFGKDGSPRLAGNEADLLREMQQAFFTIYKESMYVWLLRAGKLNTAYTEALALLRASHSGNDEARRKFEREISKPDAQSFQSLVGYFSVSFGDRGGTLAAHKRGYELLLRQPEAVLTQLSEDAADYTLADQRYAQAELGSHKSFEMTLLDFLIDRVPRTEFSVRAIAILRSRETDVGKVHVELASEIIPPGGEDARPRVLKTLGDLDRKPEGAGRQLEATYNLAFKNVGHETAQHKPDTLRGHLGALQGWYHTGVYHHALALLNHKPTAAEELYFALARDAYADWHKAIVLLNDFAQANISRRQLSADWLEYVNTAQPGNAEPFSTMSLEVHIGSLSGDAAQSQVLRLLSSLNRDDVSRDQAALDQAAKGAEEAVSRPTGSEAERDSRVIRGRELRFSASETRLRFAEQPRLAAAEVSLSRQSDATDAERVDALKEINLIHAGRVERARKALAEVGGDARLSERANTTLVADLGDVLLREQNEWNDARKRMIRLIDTDESGLSNAGKILGRLALMSKPTDADELYVLVGQREYKRATDLVTRVWAPGGGIRKLWTDAAVRHADDAIGVERPAYDVQNLISYLASNNPSYGDYNAFQKIGAGFGWVLHGDPILHGELRRVSWLTAHDLSDVERGVGALYAIADHGAEHDKSATDLAEVLKFLGTPGLHDPLRRAVIELYYDKYVSKAPAAAVQKDQGPAAEAAADKPDRKIEGWLGYIFRRFEGDSENYRALRSLLLPPTTDRERALEALQLSRLGGGSVTQGFSDWWEDTWGTHRRQAMARSGDWLQYIAQASPDELKRMQRESGLSKPAELGKYYFDQFRERRATLRALEDAVVDKLADLVEVAVEGVITLVTGGAALPAVLASMAAACANIAVHEVAQGKNFKTVSWENVNAVLQAGIGAFAVEGGLRDKVVNIIKLKELGAAGGALRWGQEWTQNAVTGVIESVMSSAVDLSFGAIFKEFGNSDEDVAKQLDLLLGKVVAKGFGTLLTMRFHPGLYHVEMAVAPRFFVQVMFKTGLRVDSIAKEVVKLWFSSKENAPFLDNLTDIALKIAFGEIKSIGKSAFSTAVADVQAGADKEFVTRFRRQKPEEFAEAVLKAIAKRYEDSEGKELQDKIAAVKKDKPEMSEEKAILQVLKEDWKFGQQVFKDTKDAAKASYAKDAALAEVSANKASDEARVAARKNPTAAPAAGVRRPEIETEPVTGYRAFGSKGERLSDLIERKNMKERLAARPAELAAKAEEEAAKAAAAAAAAPTQAQAAP